MILTLKTVSPSKSSGISSSDIFSSSGQVSVIQVPNSHLDLQKGQRYVSGQLTSDCKRATLRSQWSQRFPETRNASLIYSSHDSTSFGKSLVASRRKDSRRR